MAGASVALLIPGLISAEACLVGLVVLSLIGFGILAWWDREGRSRPAVAAAASKLATTALQLDSQATAVLELVRTYLDAGERYSVTLAQAGKNLPTSASPDEIGIIVKFLLAENAKMQHEAGELKKSLEKSKSQNRQLALASGRSAGNQHARPSHLPEQPPPLRRQPGTRAGRRAAAGHDAVPGAG